MLFEHTTWPSEWPRGGLLSAVTRTAKIRRPSAVVRGFRPSQLLGLSRLAPSFLAKSTSQGAS